MTLRNWAIGYYIVEYEQDGSDRAEYGSHLLKNLEKQIDQKGMNYTLFKACRQFYKVYPQIGSTVSSEFKFPLAREHRSLYGQPVGTLGSVG